MADTTISEFAFDTLSPGEGDIIVVKLPPDPAQHTVRAVAQALTAKFPNNDVFMLPHDLELETVDENRMRDAGWMPIT